MKSSRCFIVSGFPGAMSSTPVEESAPKAEGALTMAIATSALWKTRNLWRNRRLPIFDQLRDIANIPKPGDLKPEATCGP
jgi:hypothetical protein